MVINNFIETFINYIAKYNLFRDKKGFHYLFKVNNMINIFFDKSNNYVNGW